MLSKQLSFDKLHNIRDLGGMSAADGKLIADNCFLRSGHLEYLSELCSFMHQKYNEEYVHGERKLSEDVKLQK